MASKLKLTGITLAVLLGSVGVAAGLGAMKKPPEKKKKKIQFQLLSLKITVLKPSH